MQGILALAF